MGKGGRVGGMAGKLGQAPKRQPAKKGLGGGIGSRPQRGQGTPSGRQSGTPYRGKSQSRPQPQRQHAMPSPQFMQRFQGSGGYSAQPRRFGISSSYKRGQ